MNRIAFYSHDTFGLGHLTRTLRLTRAARAEFPEAHLLVLTGSPVAESFDFPVGTEIVRLPTVVKTGAERYRASKPDLSFRHIRKHRVSMIRDTLLRYAPEILFVDNVPAGMKGELVPTLAALRKQSPATQIHLNLRDVIDDDAVVRQTWIRSGAYELFENCYDAINLFGSPDILPVAGSYGLPESKTRYLGYVTPQSEDCRPLPALKGSSARLPLVLVTAGGGGDGAHLERAAIEASVLASKKKRFRMQVITGPFMPERDKRVLHRLADSVEQLTILDYARDLPRRMATADLVICMGGYNTLAELLVCRQRALVVPRTRPRREQEIRARAFEKRGLVEVIEPTELDGQRLLHAIQRNLQRETGTRLPQPPPLGGAEAFRALLADLHRGADRLKPRHNARYG